MKVIPIEAVPNQETSVVVDNNQWVITIKTADSEVAVSLVRNGITIVDSARAVANFKIIPATYQEEGNFLFVTLGNEIPDYTKFNQSQQLVYISQAELEAAREPTPPPITDDFFDPAGGLPLRYAPQGYVLA